MIRLMGLVDLKKVNEDATNMSPEEEKVNIKAQLMSIHNLSKEAYNVLDDQDDPEDWVIDKVQEISKMLNSVHSHLTYEKKKSAELADEISDQVPQRSW